ncbi:nucleotide triphosphate diphosphatase NUDT15 [Dictyobacter aurantiacus]|uniref:NUDIX domain-containing protein n=1 Tax=Dictyobacter aurantiacus TaxID=1936993 RepID=A0A401ZKT6_9CHLR|nr:NUDIX domain-containing protein [Dictyobacter aurantiacus]GCE07424.1 NUDIX domain-containing protein [Dictyobacter aurantiacus]
MLNRPAVGVGVIIQNGDRVLLMKRRNSHGDGTWSMPGGHLEYGESPQECAIREAQEEVGVLIANPIFRTITNDIFEQEGKHYVTIWMEATYVSGEARVNSAREMSEVGWFTWNDLPTPRFLPLQHLLAQGYLPSQ